MIYFNCNGPELKRVIMKNCYSQRELGRITGIHSPLITAFISGRSRLRKDEVESICKALKCSTRRLGIKRYRHDK
jgi:DNA-binding Xre family transcriptional regulator